MRYRYLHVLESPLIEANNIIFNGELTVITQNVSYHWSSVNFYGYGEIHVMLAYLVESRFGR